MNYYARMTTKVNPEPVMLVFDSMWERHDAIDKARHVGAAVVECYANEVKKAERSDAVKVKTWTKFIRSDSDYDFGYPIKYCPECARQTHHIDEDTCGACEERLYSLRIWVLPRQAFTDTGMLDSDDGFRMEKNYDVVKAEPIRLDTLQIEDGVAHLVGLMIKSKAHQLKSNVHAIVSHDIIERVKDEIVKHTLSDLNLKEIRWYYVVDGGYLRYFHVQIPPHWEV